MTERLLQLIEEHEYLSIFSILFIEEAGIPLPLPGDTVMLFAGYLVHAGKMNAFLSLLSLEIGTMAGASTLYWVARFGGRPFVLRYGRWFGLSRERIAKLEDWLKRHGTIAILVGRLTPGLRIPTSIICGALQAPYRTFLPLMTLGSFLYILAWFILGFALGEETARLLSVLQTLPSTVIMLLLAAIVVATTLLLVLRRK